jgi:hypothetical protein
MGLVNIPQDIELNQEWKAKRHPVLFAVFETFLPQVLMPLAVFSSAIAMSIGWDFSFSPIVFLAGFPISLIVLLVMWIAGMLTFGLFLGQASFINSLFKLLPLTEYEASQLFIMPFLYAAKMLYVALRHGNMNYSARLFLLIASCFLIYRNSDIFMGNYVEKDLWLQAGFVYSVEFLIFLAVMKHEFGREATTKNHSRNQVRHRERSWK